MRYGAIEAGGTKFVCAVGDEHGNVEERVSFPTSKPEETLQLVVDFFHDKQITALGVGAFGPVDVKENSPSYGTIGNTPKLQWTDYPLLKELESKLNVPVKLNTDVNAAALGEYMHGAAKHADSCLYITVGTGIGAGAIVNGKTLQGFSHPEMGHIVVRKSAHDAYPGNCPYHRDCLEGLAAGPAIEARWGEKAQKLYHQDEVWRLEAYYLAQAIMSYTLVLSPGKIIMGGGVMKKEGLHHMVQQELEQLMQDYVPLPENYLVPPGLQDNAGIVGALLLAKEAQAKGKEILS
ncbi:ROK family protein [Terribacillus saccharophilus]|uniref:ROK family protein n=1 Tax=Terribacillus saccharophilus TaxID=361277 RepID=UPI0039826DF1